MTGKEKVEKEKEKTEWYPALEMQEKRMLEGMQEICIKMGDSIKESLHADLDGIKNPR